MEQFVYTKKHLDAVKKYKIMKIMFLALGCFVLALQSITWLVVWLKDVPVKISDMWFVGITLVYSLYFVASQIFFIIHSRRITAIIKKQGSFTTKRVKLRFSDKSTLAGAFSVFCKILAVIFVAVLGVMIFNFVTDFVAWGKVILKTPLVVLCAIEFLNLAAEISYQAMLEKMM